MLIGIKILFIVVKTVKHLIGLGSLVVLDVVFHYLSLC